MSESGEQPFFLVDVDEAARTVRLDRTSRPYDSTAEIVASFRDVDRRITEVPRPAYVLIIDLRAAIGRNDPEFERAIEKPRTDMMRPFAQTVLVVKSAVGRLHVERHARESGLTNVIAFTDADEAIEFARRYAARPEVRARAR